MCSFWHICHPNSGWNVKLNDVKESAWWEATHYLFFRYDFIAFKNKNTKIFFFSFNTRQESLKICSSIPPAKKIMQGTDVLHDSLLKSFSEIKGTQAFFKKTKILAWGSKTCSLFDRNRAAPVYGRSAIFTSKEPNSLFWGNRGTPDISRGAIFLLSL
jgi:hypothetical protein